MDKKIHLLGIASAMLLPFVSQGAGPAFTGITATADTAETVATNPAGMARLKEPSAYGNPMVIFTRSETEFESETGGSGSVDNDAVSFLPGFYYVHPINQKWAVGIGPNAATGIGTAYDDDWAGRYVLEEWSQVFASIAPAVSYRVDEKLSLGLGLPLTYSRFTLNKSVFNGVGESDGEMEFESDGFGVGVTLSLLYEFDARNRIGVSYNSEITIESDEKPDFSGLTPAREAVLEGLGILTQSIELESTRPQFVLVGYYHDFDNGWSMTIDGLWMDFSEMGVSNVSIGGTSLETEGSDYKDIWGLTWGVEWQYDRSWSWRAGLAYLSSPLDEADRTVFSRMGEVIAVGGGVEYTTRKGRAYALDVTYLQFSDGKFAVEDAPGVGDLSGRYSSNFGIAIGLGVKW